jgi:hypothetical protein
MQARLEAIQNQLNYRMLRASEQQKERVLYVHLKSRSASPSSPHITELEDILPKSLRQPAKPISGPPF